MLYKISRLAESDIDQIFNHIAQNSFINAHKWLNDIYSTFGLLNNFPLIGSLRNDIHEEVRFWPFGKYLILYHVTDPIKIVRVLSSYRNLNLLFKPNHVF